MVLFQKMEVVDLAYALIKISYLKVKRRLLLQLNNPTKQPFMVQSTVYLTGFIASIHPVHLVPVPQLPIAVTPVVWLPLR